MGEMSAPPPLRFHGGFVQRSSSPPPAATKEKNYHQRFQTHCALEAQLTATVHTHFFLLSGPLRVATKASRYALDPCFQTQRRCEQQGYENQTVCKTPHFFILGGDKDHGEDLKQDLGRTCVGVCMWFPSFPQDLNIQAIHDQLHLTACTAEAPHHLVRPPAGVASCHCALHRLTTYRQRYTHTRVTATRIFHHDCCKY